MITSSQKTVYIIEEDTDLLSSLSMILTRNGYAVVMDFNGDDFDVKNEARPDLYVIDINLINKDGGEICKEIKCHSPSIYIILMSANVDLEHTAAINNANRYIKKPFSSLQMIQLIAELLD